MPRWWSLRKLGSPKPGQRLRAIETLQALRQDPEVVQALRRTLTSDPDLAVRAAAAHALGAMGDLASVPALLRLHAESARRGAGEQERAAKAAILEMGEPVLAILSNDAADPDVWVRRSAAELTKKVRQRERRASLPLADRQDPDRIADRLARDLEPRLVDRPRSRAQDRRSHRCAMEDLRQLRELPPESVKKQTALIEHALSSASEPLCLEALETLFHALREEAIPRLLALLGSSPLGPAAATMLASLGEAAPLRQLVDLLRDPHVEAPRRVHAARTLGRLRRGELLPVLLSALSDPSPAVRAEICAALAEVPDPRATGDLIRCLRDQDASVREKAILALGRLAAGDELAAATPELIRCLRDPAAPVRQAAIQILGEHAAEEAVPELERCLREDPYTETREWETWFGPRLEDQGVEEVYPVREAAAAALEKLRRSLRAAAGRGGSMPLGPHATSAPEARTAPRPPAD